MIKLCVPLILIMFSTIGEAASCKIVDAKICPNDDFSLGCAGKYGHQVICEARSRVFLSRNQAEKELQELKKIYKLNFDVLYAYYSEDLDLIEIKRTDLPEGSPKSSIYKWLIISRKEKTILSLTFVEMWTQGEEVVRTFSEGELRTSKSEGFFQYKGINFLLNQEPSNQISTEKINLIRIYLATHPNDY